jgi:hypothetical protein
MDDLATLAAEIRQVKAAAESDGQVEAQLMGGALRPRGAAMRALLGVLLAQLAERAPELIDRLLDEILGTAQPE